MVTLQQSFVGHLYHVVILNQIRSDSLLSLQTVIIFWNTHYV